MNARRTAGRWRWRGIGVAWCAWCVWCVGMSARAEVSLTLRVPEAESWVLGDAIPLTWRFANGSTQALGFMWEGCCRLNGRLEVSRAETGERLSTVPPGQALAHMFAKADRLEPGVAKEYDTRVGDWVALPGTGRYRLEGMYRGVLPSQFPQVPRGLGLWRDEARSSAVEFSVSSVADYLGQRDDRIRRRGWHLELAGPARWSPTGTNRFSLSVRNLRSEPRTLHWPDAFSLWVVDVDGRRKAPMAVIPGATAPRTVPSGGSTAWEFPVAADRFEGESLGDYRVFVDLAEGEDREPRVPSNTLPLAWRLGADEVLALVREAARGAGAGARNAPLKMLRVYLGDLGPELSRLDRRVLDPEARRLVDRLTLAARLRPLAPRPGDVGIRIVVGDRGELRWGDPVVHDGLGETGGSVSEQAKELLAVRRHLGWEITLVLAPSETVTLGTLADAASSLTAGVSEGLGPPEIRWSDGGTNAPARFVFSGATEDGAADGEALLRGEESVRVEPGRTWVSVRRAVPWGQVLGRLAGTVRPGERREIRVIR